MKSLYDNFSGHSLSELVSHYQTPLYVFSQDIFEEHAKSLHQAFRQTGCAYEINLAGKAFMNQAICKIAEKADLSMDCASGGELYTALSAGFDPKKITLHGSNKSEEEIAQALDAEIGRIVIDSEDELRRLKEQVYQRGQVQEVLFRVNPGVDCHANELINTGKTDTKFGIPLDRAEEVIYQANLDPMIQVTGLHCHVGSQVTDEEGFVAAASVLAGLYRKLVERGVDLKILNLGGGFGVAYTQEDRDFDPVVYIPKMVSRIQALFDRENIAMPLIMIEPGRYLTAKAGVTVYTVGTVKEIEGVRTYVSVDGGMADNPRPALYQAKYDAKILDRELNDKNTRTVRLSGKCCESDTLIDSIELADPKPGDLIRVDCTGAYNYSMASNYNRLAKPACVLLSQNRHGLIIERENYEDLIRQDRIPEWLN